MIDESLKWVIKPNKKVRSNCITSTAQRVKFNLAITAKSLALFLQSTDYNKTTVGHFIFC